MRGFFNKVWDPLMVWHALDCIAADTNYLNIYSHTGSRDFEKGGVLCRPPWLEDEKIFGFQMVWKGQKNVWNDKFLAKYFFQYFQYFSPYLYLMKACRLNLTNFFKIHKRFDKEREITLIQWSMKKENWQKLGFVL